MEGAAPSPDNRKELFKGDNWVLPTDIDLVDAADDAFRKKLEDAGWNEDDTYFFWFVFHEALINAIAHGNLGIVKKDDGSENIGAVAKREQKLHPTNKKVFISIKIEGKKVTVVIRDEGNGFKPKEVPDPKSPEGMLLAQGKGLDISREFVDSLTHSEKGNEVTIVKERKG